MSTLFLIEKIVAFISDGSISRDVAVLRSRSMYPLLVIYASSKVESIDSNASFGFLSFSKICAFRNLE